MVEIPAGEFILGSNQGGYNEKPQHVSMIDAYWIDRYEVTYQQYMVVRRSEGVSTAWTAIPLCQEA